MIILGLAALLTAVVSVLLTPPAIGYESSLFHAYHPLTWAAFAIAFVSLLTAILAPHYRIRAIIGIGILYTVFLTLPAIRNYVLFATPQADILFHMGIISDIISEGRIPYLFYPAPHTLFSTVLLITGLSDIMLQSISAITFTLILVSGIVLTTRRFLSSAVGPFILVAALPFVYGIHHISFHPWFFGLTLIPLLLFLNLIRDQARQWEMSTMVLTIGAALILYHILTAIVAVFIVVGLLVLRWLSQRHTSFPDLVAPTALATALILWVVYLDRFEILVRRFFIAQLAPGGGVGYVTQAGSTDRTLWQLLELVFLQWGTVILYSGLGSLIVFGLLLGWRKSNLYPFEHTVVTGFGIGVVFGSALALAQVFARNPLRILQFALLFSIFLLGIALWRVGRSETLAARVPKSGQTALTAGIFVCILITGLLGGATLYPDHRHLTETTVEGTAWHLDYHDRSQPTISQHMAHNMELYLSGYTDGRTTERVFYRHDSEVQLPNRLGYANSTAVGEWATDRYLLTKREDRVWAASIPENRKDDVDHYRLEDEARLADDSSVNRLYTNGEFQTWHTRGRR